MNRKFDLKITGYEAGVAIPEEVEELVKEELGEVEEVEVDDVNFREY